MRSAAAALAVAALAIPSPARAQTAAATDDPCTLADALREAGAAKPAAREYVTLLRRDPALECAKRGLAEINRPPADTSARDAKRLCARGDAYRAVHREADALAAYKSALEKNPAERCARKGIRKTTASLPARVVDDVADALPQYALVAGLLIALFFTVLLLGYIGPVHARLVRLPGVRRILSPRLNMDALDDKSGKSVGAALSTRIGQRLTRMRDEAQREGTGHELDLGTPRESFADLVSRNRGLKSALDNASEIGDQAKIVAALLKLLYTLLPIRRLTVAGVVEPALDARASATLSLERDGTLMAAATLHASREGSPSTGEPTAADYVELAKPAAVWVQYEVARAIEGGKDVSPDAAESYALVREGLDRQMAGEYGEARECYERARDLDPHNWAARLNLAMTEARLSGQYVRAVDLLAEAFTEIRRP